MEKESLEKELREISFKNKQQTDQLVETHFASLSKLNQVFMIFDPPVSNLLILRT